MKMVKYIFVGSIIIFAFYFGKTFLSRFSSSYTPNETVNKVDQQKSTSQTFKSEKGSFAIDLPSQIKMFEKPERLADGIIYGEVWFTFGEFDENAPSGLVVVYGKQIIDGKGGACVDEKGENGYKKETIAGQVVDVCEIGEFRAEYFTHPNKQIEYHIGTSRLSSEQIKLVSEAVRKTLRFE